MCFFLSNSSKFLKSQIYDNYNGILASIYNIPSVDVDNNQYINNNIFPITKYNLLDYINYNTDNYKICITSSNSNCLLYNTELDIIVWYKIPNNSITKSKLLRILLDVNWIEQLKQLEIPISFVIKDKELYYLYTNNSEIYYDNNLNISTKPFLSCEVIENNTPYMIDFYNKQLIKF